MNKITNLSINDSFSPEENLKELSFLDDEEGANSKNFAFSQRNAKKISMIEGWVKAKDIELDINSETRPNTQAHRKTTRPNISTARSHYSHIAFTPKPININQPHTEALIFHHIKKRPMSSTIARHDRFSQSLSPFQNTPERQKVHHQYLKKNCGIRNSRKSLEKDGKKKTIESFIYPVFDTSHFQNPEKLIPNIGRISYLVKCKKRNSMEERM